MARIPAATRGTVPRGQQSALDEMVRRIGSVPRDGPGSVMINVPEAYRKATHLVHYLRDERRLLPDESYGESPFLPTKVQELAMLVTARELNCKYIWNAHAGRARRAGLSDTLVDALRDRNALPDLSPDETAVINYGQEFFRTHRVPDRTFEVAMRRFGVRGLVELTLLMGYYALLAFCVNAFEVDLPEQRIEPELPV